jgi:hypothetical protein
MGLLLTCTPAFTEVPSDPKIRKIVADRFSAADNGAGIVVGVVDANGRRIVSYGSLAKNDTVCRQAKAPAPRGAAAPVPEAENKEGLFL